MSQIEVNVQQWAPTNWPQQWGILDVGGLNVSNSDAANGWSVTADNAASPTVLTVTYPDGVAGAFTVRWRGYQRAMGYWMWFTGDFSTL